VPPDPVPVLAQFQVANPMPHLWINNWPTMSGGGRGVEHHQEGSQPRRRVGVSALPLQAADMTVVAESLSQQTASRVAAEAQPGVR
jgi:hypothetical protein